MKTFVGVIGTTSVGKSAVAVQLAKKLGTEVISADSMQIYKGMDIGTAKITKEEMQGIRHHMLSIVQPNGNFSSFLYREQASRIIDSMDTLPIVVGGTGLYFDSIVYPPEYGSAPSNRREELLEILDSEGLEKLVELLKKTDPKAAESIDLHNPKRVIRAIEIAECGQSRTAGKTKSNPQYNMILFELQCERAELYKRIDLRVDKMVQMGLVDEVKNLVDHYGICDTTAFSAIGYKEIIKYLQGEISLEAAKEQIKLNTRHYAKRQITYFKKMNVEKVINIEGKSSAEVAEEIYFCLQQKHIIRD